MSEPESPAQFNAYFSESLYEDISVPSRSQYKVTYQIYAGRNEGLSYKVYLKNPPANYVNVNPTYEVASGYLEADDGKIDTLTFVAVSGYSTLCVNLNGVENCGFGSVTSNLMGEYIKEKYVETEVRKNKITTEKDCISSSPSIFNINGKNIELLGITRICASSDPNSKEDINSENQWIEVGYCGNENIKCWLDVESIQEDFNAKSTISGKSILDNLIYGDTYESILQSYKDVREKILELKRDINIAEDLSKEKDSLIEKLDKIIGVSGEDLGEGTNRDKAEALYLKVILYQKLYQNSNKPNDISKVISDKEETKESEGETPIEELTKVSVWTLSSENEICLDGEPLGYYLDPINLNENKYRILNSKDDDGWQIGLITKDNISIYSNIYSGSIVNLENYIFDGKKFILKEGWALSPKNEICLDGEPLGYYLDPINLNENKYRILNSKDDDGWQIGLITKDNISIYSNIYSGSIVNLENYIFDGKKFILKEGWALSPKNEICLDGEPLGYYLDPINLNENKYRILNSKDDDGWQIGLITKDNISIYSNIYSGSIVNLENYIFDGKKFILKESNTQEIRNSEMFSLEER